MAEEEEHGTERLREEAVARIRQQEHLQLERDDERRHLASAARRHGHGGAHACGQGRARGIGSAWGTRSDSPRLGGPSLGLGGPSLGRCILWCEYPLERASFDEMRERTHQRQREARLGAVLLEEGEEVGAQDLEQRGREPARVLE